MSFKNSLNILNKYTGNNDYILKLKKKSVTNPNFYLTSAQSQYILNYHNVKPKSAKKWVNINKYYGKKIANEKMLIDVPDKIWVEKLLVEKEKAYHILGKFSENEELTEYWVPKDGIIKANDREISIDYSKYQHRPPLPHQKIAIENLLRNDKYILADDMGLGKSTSAIIAALETGSKKILIICPASLKLNWERELENYTDRSISIAEGKKFTSDTDFVIINYEIIKNFHDIKKPKESLIKNNFDLIIIDEAHMVSNIKAKRTKLVNDICRNTERVWLLTGTPITSRPINYFNLLSIVNSPLSDNWQSFVIKFCGGYKFRLPNGQKVWNTNGSSNLEELRDRTSDIILRRLKSEVLDLPEKIITPIFLSIDKKEYTKTLNEYKEWYKNNTEESSSLTLQLSMITKLRQYIAIQKVKHTIEIAENILSNEKKILIFTNFTEPLKLLVNHFGKKCVHLDGSSTQKERQEAVDKFQTNNKVKVFVGNIKAAGVGITLTEAEAVIMNDLSFVPSDHTQAEDRAYRYGQKFNVSVYYPVFEKTIDIIIYNILKNKKNIFETIMGDNVDKTNTIKMVLKYLNDNI